jgi:membrane protein YqaA with SNARE-associated domain
VIGIDPSGLGTAALLAATFLLALASGLVPFVINTELYLLGVALFTDASPVAIVALATGGQMLGKFAVYQVGRGSLNIPWIQRQAAAKAAAGFARHGATGLGVLGVSAITGVPPFYAVSFMCGVLRMRIAAFLAIGTAGRVIRFSAVFLFPALFT